MSKASKLRPGDVIRHGRSNGTVTHVTQPELNRVVIEWERGSASGVLACPPDQDVKTVYKPKRKWSW